MRLVWLGAAAAALALAGCDREPGDAAAPVAKAAAGLPLAFESKTAHAEASLKLPAALAAHAALHRTLYEQEIGALKTFAADAARDRAQLTPDMPPYAMEVSWRVAAETPRLLSLVRDEYSFAGGAHPNTAATTLLYDKAAGREVEPAALAPGVGPAQERVLCDALKRAKAERGGVDLDGESWSCPRWKDSQAALAAGRGGATGLTFLFSPYEVGPYAEGAYEVTLPAATFRSAVAPEYRDQFAG
jgi:hypothetical protein